jgi:polyhydroxyalkanoate synthase
MHAYPGRTFGQLYHQVLRTNDLADGRLELGGRDIDLADATVPLLAIAGRGDGIAPVAACHHLGDLVDGVRLRIAPGGHLGVLTGRAARATTWAMLDRWLTRAR